MPDGHNRAYCLSEVLAEELTAFGAILPEMPDPPQPDDPEAVKKEKELARRRQLYRVLGEQDLSALCLSGGGIRSASFCLGVIQALAEAGLLDKFRYLSTVSGGGYIGSWLSAWLHRAGSAEVLRQLRPARRDADIEPRPIRHLREYGSYLTPQVGLLSADTWAAVAIILRNILLNWLILIPAIWLPVLGLKLVAALAHTGSDVGPGWDTVVAVLCLIFASIALGYKLLRLYWTDERTDTHLAQRNFLVLSVFPGVLAGACFSWLAVVHNTPKGALLFWPHTPGLGLSWLRMLEFSFLIYLGAHIAAAIGYFFVCRGAKPREPIKADMAWDVAAWLAAVLVFGTAVWIGFSMYTGLPTHEENTVILYKDMCVAGATSCTADAKPVMHKLSVSANREVLLVIFGMPWFLLSTLLAHTTYLFLRSYSRIGDVDREWLGRASGWQFSAGLLWLALSGVVLLGPKLYYGSAVLGDNAGRWLAAISAASGTVTALLGKAKLTPAQGSATGWKGISLNVVLAIAASLFAITLLILLSAWSDGIVLFEQGGACFSLGIHHIPGIHQIPEGCYDARRWIALVVIVLIVMLAAGFLVNVNRFSLHAVYRNRLVRAYLGASNQDRKAEGFTGFDWNDNLRVAGLWGPTPGAGPAWRPFHVINIALNLAATRKLAWQYRKAISFTVTPKFCGAAELGYRQTREYGDPNPDGMAADGKPIGGITLGTAMAISGAPASPNMGYHSSPAAAFLMTMFDVRLGWWLGNPGRAGQRVYHRDGPRFALRPILAELFGLTQEDSPYVYLSDGGHFDDLGLYEMMRRRCKWIVVVDADADPERGFVDLGEAVRRVGIDLGIRIRFPESGLLQITAKTDAKDIPYCALGTIKYLADATENSPCPTGFILYVKPTVRGDEGAADVISYSRANPPFPHQSTGDQWFDEPQLEAYRALGYLTMTRIIEAARLPAPELASLFDGLRA